MAMVDEARASRPSRGAAERWLPIWLQSRRRKRKAVSAPLPGAPPAPTGLVATDFGNYVELIWDEQIPHPDGFKIYRKVGAGSFSLLATVDASGVLYADFAVVVQTVYTYYITAFVGASESGPSNQVSLTFGA